MELSSQAFCPSFNEIFHLGVCPASLRKVADISPIYMGKRNLVYVTQVLVKTVSVVGFAFTRSRDVKMKAALSGIDTITCHGRSVFPTFELPRN